jgi:hypothetical protein
MKRGILLLFLFNITILPGAPASAQQSVRINWTAVTGAQSRMFMARQEGLLKKKGAPCSALLRRRAASL